MESKFLLRKSSGDQPVASEADLRDWFRKGQCKPSDFLYDFASGLWCRVGDHAAMAEFFADKPAQAPERRVIYYLPAGGTSFSQAQGPLSTKELQQRAQLREVCSQTWVFVEGDKEWRQVRSVKVLADMLPPLPTDKPSPPPPEPAALEPPPAPPLAPREPAAEPSGLDAFGLHFGDMPPPAQLSEATPPPSPPPAPVAAPAREPGAETSPSISLDMGITGETPSPVASTEELVIEREDDATVALDTLGLNLKAEAGTPPPFAKPAGIAPLPTAPAPAPARAPTPAAPRAPAPPPPSAAMAAAVARQQNHESDSFDGIVAEIPSDPIWLVKQASSEAVSGPFRFLEVVRFLQEGKLTKNDKIARAGTKAFVKIQQQYEFNVKFSLETVIENGMERQKILIRRRHPRVPYITGVQILSRHGLLAGSCVNISAGGILMEVPKADFNLGEIIDTKILPGLIPKAISCRSLVIGKIPKIPPGYALKFEDLKPDDKEAIEFYVQETLKREMAKKT